MPDTAEPGCPDSGACHHACPEGRCWRVLNAEPLSAAGYPEDRWPAEIVKARLDAEPGVTVLPPYAEEDAPLGVILRGSEIPEPWQEMRSTTQVSPAGSVPPPAPDLGDVLRAKREEIGSYGIFPRSQPPPVTTYGPQGSYSLGPDVPRDPDLHPELRGHATGPMPSGPDLEARTDSFMAVTEEPAGRHRRAGSRRRHRTDLEQLDRPGHPAWQALWRPLAFLVLHWSRLCGAVLPGWTDARMAGMRRRFERRYRRNPDPRPVAVVTVRADTAAFRQSATRAGAAAWPGHGMVVPGDTPDVRLHSGRHSAGTADEDA